MPSARWPRAVRAGSGRSICRTTPLLRKMTLERNAVATLGPVLDADSSRLVVVQPPATGAFSVRTGDTTAAAPRYDLFKAVLDSGLAITAVEPQRCEARIVSEWYPRFRDWWIATHYASGQLVILGRGDDAHAKLVRALDPLGLRRVRLRPTSRPSSPAGTRRSRSDGWPRHWPPGIRRDREAKRLGGAPVRQHPPIDRIPSPEAALVVNTGGRHGYESPRRRRGKKAASKKPAPEAGRVAPGRAEAARPHPSRATHRSRRGRASASSRIPNSPAPIPLATETWARIVLGWKFGEPVPTPGGPYHMWRFENETGGGIRSSNPS